MSKDYEAHEIFSPDNTEWETDYDDYGYPHNELVFSGCLDDYADELGISYDRAYELLAEYQEMSEDLIEELNDIEFERSKYYGSI